MSKNLLMVTTALVAWGGASAFAQTTLSGTSSSATGGVDVGTGTGVTVGGGGAGVGCGAGTSGK